jgi:hypothetical protein
VSSRAYSLDEREPNTDNALAQNVNFLRVAMYGLSVLLGEGVLSLLSCILVTGSRSLSRVA